MKIDDLNGETLLLLEDGHCLRDQALDVCSRIDVKESEDYRATSLETLRQMVAAGLGITLLPELATRGPVRLRPGTDGQGVRQAGSFAQRRRGLAQEHGTHRSHQGRVRSHPLVDGLLSA